MISKYFLSYQETDISNRLLKINHPNVCKVYDFIVEKFQNTTYLVMELVSGKTLQEWISSKKQFEGKHNLKLSNFNNYQRLFIKFQSIFVYFFLIFFLLFLLENEVRFIMNCLLEGIDYLHS